MLLWKRIVPFFTLCFLTIAIAALLTCSVEPPQRSYPWGRKGDYISAFTYQTMQSDQNLRNSSTQAPPINSTIIVQDSTPDEVTLFIIIGTSINRPDRERLLGYADYSEATFNGAPILKVTANPSTGTILSAGVYNGTDPSLTTLGLQLAREIFINQEKAAYSTPNLKVKDDETVECSYPEIIDGATFCPEFTETRTDTSIIYTKSYSTASLLSKKYGDSFSSDAVMHTQVNAETGLLEAATSSGEITLEMFRSGDNSTMTTIFRTSVTYFHVQLGTFSSPAVVRLHEIHSSVAFQPVNLKPMSDIPSVNSTRQHNARELNSPATNSDTYTMFSMFGTPAYLQYEITFNPNSTYITAKFQIGTSDWYTVADQTCFNDMLPLIWQVLGLRNTAKSNMQAILSLNDNFVAQVQTNIKSAVLDYSKSVKSIVDALNTKIELIVNNVKQMFDNYKARMERVEIYKVQQLQKTVTTGKQQIDQIKLTVDPSDQAALITPIQESVNSAQTLLDQIVQGSYSWQTEFEQNDLTTIDSVFEPFYSLDNEVAQAIPQISTLTKNMQSSLDSTFTKFKNDMVAPANTVTDAFRHVESNQATQISSDPDIFDFSFVDSIISSVQSDLSTISTNLNELRDFLYEKTLSQMANVTSLFKPTSWLSEVKAVNTKLLALQYQYHYSISQPAITEKWIIETLNSLKADILTELSQVTIADLASSMKYEFTSAPLDGVVEVSKVKDTLVQAFLGKAVQAQKTTVLLNLSKQVTVFNGVSTPYGTHYPSTHYSFQTSMVTSVILDGNQFVSTLNLVITANFAESYVITDTSGLTGARGNLKVGVQLTASFLNQASAYRTPANVNFNTNLIYQVTGQDSFSYQKEVVTWGQYCWEECDCLWWCCSTECGARYPIYKYDTAVVMASDNFNINSSIHLVEQCLILPSR